MVRRPCIERDCVIEHNGRKYESGGSVITDDHLIAYPGKGGVLKTWHGKPIGTWRIVSSWRVNSAYGSYMHQIEATVDGITYTGRGFGEGAVFKGRRKGRRPQAKTDKQWTPQQLQAHRALMKASEKMGWNNYQVGLAAHVRAGRKKHTYRYAPTEEHERVIKASSDVLKGKITPEQAMAILHEYDIFKQRVGKRGRK